MLGTGGLQKATEYAILNANYIKERLKDHYKTLYSGERGRAAHEMIVDCRPFKEKGIEVTDIAKRLIDHGFHPPTTYFPLIVRGALMIEPTESYSKEELDAFIEAMIAISQEATENPEKVTGAPADAKLTRLDEVRAARHPVLRWLPDEASSSA